jgi:hypothetical protein
MRWRVGLVNGGGMAYRSGIGQGSRHTPPGPMPASQETLVCAASNTVPNYDELGFSPGIISRCRISNEEAQIPPRASGGSANFQHSSFNLSDGWVRKDCCQGKGNEAKVRSGQLEISHRSRGYRRRGPDVQERGVRPCTVTNRRR